MSQPSSDPPSSLGSAPLPGARAPTVDADASGPDPAPGGGATPVVRATFSMRGFMDGWLHCQHVADYLARFAASDRFDPEQLTTRLATYLNEALELVFRSAPGAGELAVTIVRQPDRLEVVLRCPRAADGSQRIRRSVRRATEAEAAARYRRDFADLLATTAEEAPPASEDSLGDASDAGLLELVALHGISLALHEASDALVLHMTVPHE